MAFTFGWFRPLEEPPRPTRRVPSGFTDPPVVGFQSYFPAVPVWPTFPVLAGRDILVVREVLASSIRQKAISGRQTFQPLWQYPRYRYTIKFNALAQGASSPWGGATEWQALEDFWKTAMFAPGGIFKYFDKNDGSVIAMPFAAGDGATTQFQLSRTLSSFTEPVIDPIAATIFVNGVSQPFAFLDNSADGSGGVIVMASPPAAGAALTWTGTFNWLCQFDEDSFEFSNFMYLLWSLKKCVFTTIRP